MNEAILNKLNKLKESTQEQLKNVNRPDPREISMRTLNSIYNIAFAQGVINGLDNAIFIIKEEAELNA